ncbi:MAG: DUF5783 family protein [Halobacteriaceae archaeon]
MPELTPQEFEEKKYADYFSQLETAYKRAFDKLNERYDSELIHAIDQQILNESEPVYEGDGKFRVKIPDNPEDRIEGVIVDDAKLESVLEKYVSEIEQQLRIVFDFEEEPKA